MTYVWIHIEDPESDYWEGPAIVIKLPSLPRIGETVYLSEEAIETLISRGALLPSLSVENTITFPDGMTVLDICYIENEELPHLLLKP